MTSIKWKLSGSCLVAQEPEDASYIIRVYYPHLKPFSNGFIVNSDDGFINGKLRANHIPSNEPWDFPDEYVFDLEEAKLIAEKHYNLKCMK